MIYNQKYSGYHRVMDYLMNQILEKKIQKGDKLPTERELSTSLSVSRASIREAYKILNIAGVLDINPGRGTYIRKEFDEWVSEPMAIIFKLLNISIQDVFEFRKMIEVEIATLAVERITDTEKVLLSECYDKLIRAETEVEKSRYDKNFHHLIAKASRNHMILNAYNAMSPMLNLFTLNMRLTVIQNESEVILETLHKDIYLSIMNNDREKARKSMKAHMDIISKYIDNV